MNGPPFDLHTRWLTEVGADWSGPCGPALAPQTVRVLQRADGQQAGALNQRAALPPLLSFGLHCLWTNISSRLLRLRSRLPTEQAPVLDRDLAFAAGYTAENRTSLRTLRQHAVGAIKELERRWACVDSRLRRHQAPALRRVTFWWCSSHGQTPLSPSPLSQVCRQWVSHRIPAAPGGADLLRGSDGRLEST